MVGVVFAFDSYVIAAKRSLKLNPVYDRRICDEIQIFVVEIKQNSVADKVPCFIDRNILST